MRLDQFDLNLLVAFDALLAEKNVTLAARRLNLTQPAVSAALKRLREALNDEILVKQGKRMIPTPRALMLQPQIATALQALRGVIASATHFDPALSDRQFRIATSDYISVVLIAPLLARLQDTAPHIRIEVTLPTENTIEALEAGKLDLLVVPDLYSSARHPKELLFTERYVVVGCASNPVMRQPLSEEDFYASGHISVSIERHSSFIEVALSGDRARQVDVIAPAFLQAPWMVRGTRRLVLMHERLAHSMAPALSLAIQECPIALPSMDEMIQFHSARRDDPGLQWLCQQLRELAAQPSAA